MRSLWAALGSAWWGRAAVGRARRTRLRGAYARAPSRQPTLAPTRSWLALFAASVDDLASGPSAEARWCGWPHACCAHAQLVAACSRLRRRRRRAACTPARRCRAGLCVTLRPRSPLAPRPRASSDAADADVLLGAQMRPSAARLIKTRGGGRPRGARRASARLRRRRRRRRRVCSSTASSDRRANAYARPPGPFSRPAPVRFHRRQVAPRLSFLDLLDAHGEPRRLSTSRRPRAFAARFGAQLGKFDGATPSCRAARWHRPPASRAPGSGGGRR